LAARTARLKSAGTCCRRVDLIDHEAPEPFGLHLSGEADQLGKVGQPLGQPAGQLVGRNIGV
jgi:hypothetical protein